MGLALREQKNKEHRKLHKEAIVLGSQFIIECSLFAAFAFYFVLEVKYLRFLFMF